MELSKLLAKLEIVNPPMPDFNAKRQCVKYGKVMGSQIPRFFKFDIEFFKYRYYKRLEDEKDVEGKWMDLQQCETEIQSKVMQEFLIYSL